MKFVKGSWPNLLSLLVGAALALYASGARQGAAQARLDELCNITIPRIEKRQEMLEIRILKEIEQQRVTLEDLRVMVGRLQTTDAIYHHGRVTEK